MTLLRLLSDWSADFELSLLEKQKNSYLNKILFESVLIDTKSLKVRIDMLMTGTKIAACHQKMADCDDLAGCSKLVSNFEKYEYLCNIVFILHDPYWKGKRTFN